MCRGAVTSWGQYTMQICRLTFYRRVRWAFFLGRTQYFLSLLEQREKRDVGFPSKRDFPLVLLSCFLSSYLVTSLSIFGNCSAFVKLPSVFVIALWNFISNSSAHTIFVLHFCSAFFIFWFFVFVTIAHRRLLLTN